MKNCEKQYDPLQARQEVVECVTFLMSKNAEEKLKGLQMLSDFYENNVMPFTDLERALILSTVRPLLKQIKEKLGIASDFFFDDDYPIAS